MVVEKSVFSNTLTFNLPQRIQTTDNDIISEYVFGDKVLFEVYIDFSVIDIILDALHVKKMSDEDLFESFRGFRYYDDGVEMLINNEVIMSSDKSEIKFLFDIPDKEINSSLIIFFDKIKMTEAYYNYQRQIMLNAMGGSEYEQKLVDYMIQFGKYAGDVSVDIDVEYLADQPSEQKQNTQKTVSPIKFNGHNFSINSFKITDNLGSSDLTGKLSYEINNKQYEVKDLVYKLDNFENVLEKYLSLLSSLSSLRNKYGASDPKTALILAMVPRQDDLYSMVPLVKRGTIEFFKAINAVNGKNLELRIASPKDSDDVTINDYNIKDLMPIMQKSFEPVMEQMNRKRMQEMRNRDTQAQQNSI
jgi:hypothetical protein